MLYMRVVKRVNPKSSHHKEIFFNFFNFVSLWDDGYSLNLLWYIYDVCKSNNYDVYLTLIQFFMLIISQ